MSMRLTRSTSTLGLFDFVDDDDVNALINHLDEEPQLINIRDEVSISVCRYAEYQHTHYEISISICCKQHR